MTIVHLIWIALGLVVLWFLLKPIKTGELHSSPQPVASYEDALERLETNARVEAGYAQLEVCKTKLLTHGSQTDHVIVLMHGYTNCPAQFARLGERFFDAGYNVLIPCMPFHGRENRLSNDLRYLTAENMAAYGDWAVDIAQGLGKKVTILGFSGGGTVVTWLVQNRVDIHSAISLSAFLGLSFLPDFLTRPFINFFLAVPNFFVWWDPRTREKNPYSVYYAYPRYSLRTLVQMLRLATAVKEQALREPPKTKRILMVINDFDPGISNRMIENLMSIWKRSDGSLVQSYRFDKSMKMLHDFITPETPGVPIEQVYQRLFQQVVLLDGSSPVKTEKELG